MASPSDTARAETVKAREGYFKPAWFMDLFDARLSFGDTFWIGHFGTGIVLVPFGFFMALMVVVVMPPIYLDVFLMGYFALTGVFSVLITTAVIRTGWRAKSAGVWRWIGMISSLAISASLLVQAYIGWIS